MQNDKDKEGMFTAARKLFQRVSDWEKTVEKKNRYKWKHVNRGVCMHAAVHRRQVCEASWIFKYNPVKNSEWSPGEKLFWFTSFRAKPTCMIGAAFSENFTGYMG